MLVATDKALSIREVANRLGVSVSTVRRMLDTGELRAFKVLGQWRIRESVVEQIMQSSNDNKDQETQN